MASLQFKAKSGHAASCNSGRFSPELKPSSNRNAQKQNEKDDGDGFFCDACHKNFTSDKAFEQHNQSKRHLEESRRQPEKLK